MKKQTKQLRLSSETVRSLATGEMKHIGGGLAGVSRGTCGIGDCQTYWCLTQVSCA